MSARQIANAIEEDFIPVCKKLAQMLKYKDIKSIELDRITASKVLGLPKVTRRMRFYFSQEIPESQALDLVDQSVSLHLTEAQL